MTTTRQPPVTYAQWVPTRPPNRLQIVPGVNPMIPGLSTVYFRTVTSTFQLTHHKGASKTLPFSRPASAPLLTNTPTTPGTPVHDEPSTRVTPRLAQVNSQLEKHAQVTKMDSFLTNKDLSTHPDMATYVNLVSDSESDNESYQPVNKYPHRTLSADNIPLAAALGFPSNSPPTSQPDYRPPVSTQTTCCNVPSRWDTPLVSPSPSYSVPNSYRINTPKKISADRPQVNLPPVVSNVPGPPPDPPTNTLHLLTDYQSSTSVKPSPAKSPEINTQQNHCDTTPGPSRPLLINPATVTPTRQEPIQISLDEAVDLLNKLCTICEILLPGHGQFLCHFIYLYFLQHNRLPD